MAYQKTASFGSSITDNPAGALIVQNADAYAAELDIDKTEVRNFLATSKDTDAITVDPAEAMGSDPLDDEIDYKLTPRKYTDGLPTGLDDTPAWKKSDGTPMDLLPQIEYDLTMTDKDGKSVSKIVMIDEHGKLSYQTSQTPCQ